MKTSMILTGLFAALLLSAVEKPVLEMDLNKGCTIRNGEKNLSSIRNEKGISRLTKDGVLFANVNVDAFAEDLKEKPGKAPQPMLFRGLQNCFPESGYLDVRVTPYFNDTSKGVPHNYIVAFTDNGKKPDGSVSLFLTHHKSITLQIFFKDGTFSFLYHTPKSWKPGETKRLTAVWTPDSQKLFLDGREVASAAKKGVVNTATQLELGGRYGNHSFQGIIHSLTAGKGEPVNLKADPDGAPEKFKAVESKKKSLTR